jgi:hypothetical protein
MQPRSNLKIRRLEAVVERLHDQESFHASMAEHCRQEIAKKEAKLESHRLDEVHRFYSDYAGIEDKISRLLADDKARNDSVFDDLIGRTVEIA